MKKISLLIRAFMSRTLLLSLTRSSSEHTMRAFAATRPPCLPPTHLLDLGFGLWLVRAASHPPFSMPLLIFDDVPS